MRMIAAIAWAMIATVLIPPAFAQATDPPALCTSSATLWNAVGAGSDVAAMRVVRGQTPAACRQLVARIDARIAALTTPRPAQTSGPADPCVRARADLESLHGSTDEALIQQYLATTPAQCTLQIAQANAQLVVARRARLAITYEGLWRDAGGTCRNGVQATLSNSELRLTSVTHPAAVEHYFISEVQTDGTLLVNAVQVEDTGGISERAPTSIAVYVEGDVLHLGDQHFQRCS